jgi:DNA-binding SARP family transcriptional activator
MSAVCGSLPDRPSVAGAELAVTARSQASPAGGAEGLRDARQRLEDLLPLHDATSHPEVIAQWIAVTELTGQQGNPSAAIALFDQLAKDLATELGPHHTRTLDAIEGMVRWAEARRRD